LRKRKRSLEEDLLHTREKLVDVENLVKRHWTKKTSRALLGIVREAAVRTVKLIERALKKEKKEKKEKKDE